MKARPAAAFIFCLVGACASQIASGEKRRQWCGVGGGAAYGAIASPVAGAQALSGFNDPRGTLLGALAGLVVAPVVAVVGAVDGAVNNPCPDADLKPTDAERDRSAEDSGETVRGDGEAP